MSFWFLLSIVMLLCIEFASSPESCLLVVHLELWLLYSSLWLLMTAERLSSAYIHAPLRPSTLLAEFFSVHALRS
jgi:hypothetical protein